MRKNWRKRAASLGLALSLAAGLCACGKDGGKNENAQLAKECVYKLQEYDLPEMEGDDFNLLSSAHNDGSINLIIQLYHWSEDVNDDDIRLLSMKEDGSDVKMVRLDIPVWNYPNSGGTVVTDTQEEEAGDADESGSGSEGDSDPDAAEPAEPDGEADPDAEDSDGEAAGPDDTEDVVDTDEPVYDIWENSSYGNYVIGADGNVYAIRRYYFDDYSNGINIQKSYLTCWNMEGRQQWETELEGLQSEEEYTYVSSMSVTADGTATLMLSGDNVYKMTADSQGNVSAREPLPEEAKEIFTGIDRILSKEDGTFLVLYYDEDDWSKEYMATYDPATGAIGESSQLPSNLSYGGYNILGQGISSDLIWSNNSGLYTYKTGDEDCVQKMNYVNSDLNIGNFSAFVELDETSFVGVFYESYDDGLKAGKFTYVDPKDIPDKSVLVLAGTYIPNDMKKRVIEYNRNSDKYRIAVKNYNTFNSYDDWQAGYTQLNSDVTTGKMPDILLADGLPVENYVAKGLLEDIGKLIEKDEELSKVEYVQNVFDAYSVNDKLYYVIPDFYVNTMVGKKEIVGDRTSWTMDDMMQLKESLPESANMIGELTRGGFFQTMMRYCGSDFVDVSTGKCNFDTPNFIAMMEYAKALPEELGEDYFGDDYWMNYESQYRDNRTILCEMGIGSINNINYILGGYFGVPVSYIGFPTESGSGSYLSANECYAISSKSQYTDGAWEFLRYYLTEEYQSTLEWGLPTMRKYFDENARKGLERPYYIDENGDKQEYDETFYLNGEEITLPPLTQEQIDQVTEFILSIDKCYYYNEDVINIINEEMEAFFTGQKSAQDVARIIQNRAQNYVDENR